MTGLVRNQISKLIVRSALGLRIGLIIFSLIALLIAGASSVTRLHQDGPTEANHVVLIDQVTIDPDPADISTGSENMDAGSIPNGEPSAIIGQFILTSGLTNDQQRHQPYRLTLLQDSRILKKLSSDRPINSIALVDTDLGRQLTLVGAKPDGTS